MTNSNQFHDDEDGYVPDADDEGNTLNEALKNKCKVSIKKEKQEPIEIFRHSFTQHLNSSASRRISHQTSVINRRLDSLARLLEQDMTCAAVTYDPQERRILIATNTIHANSKATNESIKKIERVMQLLCNHQANMEEIIDSLAEILKDNLFQEERFLIHKLQLNSQQLKEQLILLFRDLFSSGQKTKQWRSHVNSGEFEEVIDGELFKKAVPRISKIARDFIKLRKSLIELNGCKTPVDKSLLNAIDEKEYQILRQGYKDAHAETRIIDESSANPSLKQTYVGISKLCCAHCGLAVNVARVQVRGQHGRGFNWIIPRSFFSDDNLLQAFMGQEAYAAYQEIPLQSQQEAIKHIQSKAGSPNDKKDRRMLPDSSDSDYEFGINDSDNELSDNLDELNFTEVWFLREIKWSYPNEFKQLQALEISRTEIIVLFRQSKDKFVALASESAFNLLKQTDESDLFERLSDIYDEDTQLFWDLITDEYDLIDEHGLDEAYDTYKQMLSRFGRYNSDSEDNDLCSMAAAKLKEQHGWDYDYNSDDSANPWGYDSSSSQSYQSDNQSELSSISNTSSDTDEEDLYHQFQELKF